LPRDAALQKRITALRQADTIVVVGLPGHDAARAELGCDRKLVRRAGKWRVVKNQ
jgi:ATP phosphoribosyltransferase regulatory subunit